MLISLWFVEFGPNGNHRGHLLAIFKYREDAEKYEQTKPYPVTIREVSTRAGTITVSF